MGRAHRGRSAPAEEPTIQTVRGAIAAEDCLSGASDGHTRAEQPGRAVRSAVLCGPRHLSALGGRPVYRCVRRDHRLTL